MKRALRIGLVGLVALACLSLGCKRPANDSPKPAASVRAGSARAPSPQPVPPTSAAILQRRLRSLEVFENVPGEELKIVVPPEARRVLRDFKDALIASVDRVLPAVLQDPEPTRALQNAMEREGYDWAASDDWDEGAIFGSVEAAPAHRERWFVQLGVLLAPGTDNLLVVYERRGGKLRQALVVRSDMYASIEGALHALTWQISPPDDEDGFYLLEAHTHPWPSSRWRSFGYRVLAPGETPGQPKVLAEAADYGNWESGFRLDARQHGFSVSFDVWSDQGPDFMATRVHRWTRRGGRFRAITPGVKLGPPP